MTIKRYTPEKINIVSSADEIGALIDIPRINGESLQDYKKRILESSRRPSNSTYEGLINAINRDLGLEREIALEILPAKKYYALNNQDIVLSGAVIRDNRYYTGTIDAVSVSAVGNKLSSSSPLFIEDELIGLKLLIEGVEYLIISNTSNSIIFDGDLSGLVNTPYEIYPNWETNSLVGLAVVTNNNKYVITSNSNNSIEIDVDYIDSHKPRYLSIEANSPRVNITSSQIILYKDYINEENFQIDKVIETRVKGLTHLGIIDLINQSSFFKANNLLGHNIEKAAFTFKKQDSDIRVSREEIPSSKFFRLKNKNIKEGSLNFSQSDIFFNETRDLINAPFGPYYYVNHKEGIIHSKKVGSGNSTVTYTYMDFPFFVESSPAVVTAFADKTAELFLFTQQEKRLYTDPRNKEMSTQPKSDMIEYIAELLKTSRQSWGE